MGAPSFPITNPLRSVDLKEFLGGFWLETAFIYV